MIKFRCDRCDQKIKVPIEYAARQVKCPGCATVVRVPQAETLPPVAPVISRQNQTDHAPTGNSSPPHSIWTDDLLNIADAGPAIKTDPNQETRLHCPTCQQEVPRGDVTCPVCGMDPRGENPTPAPPRRQRINDNREYSPWLWGIVPGLALSLGGAMIGAVIWLLVYCWLGMQLNFAFPLLIGFLAGAGAILRTGDRDFRYKLIALVMTIAGFMTGKLMMYDYACTHTNWAENFLAKQVTRIITTDKENLTIGAAYDLFKNGKLTREELDDYVMNFSNPPKDDSDQWQALRTRVQEHAKTIPIDIARQRIREMLVEEQLIAGQEARQAPVLERLSNTFSYWDIGWLLLALSVAWKFSSGGYDP